MQAHGIKPQTWPCPPLQPFTCSSVLMHPSCPLSAPSRKPSLMALPSASLSLRALLRPILSDDASPPSACAQPGRAGVCSVCRTSPWLAGRCLDNQAEDHRDASFLCLLWFTAVPTRASTAWSFELRLWPSSVLTRGRMRGLRTRGWALGEADFCYDRAGPWAVSGSVQRQLRCLQPAWPAGWEGAGAELARDAGSVVCIRSHPHSCPSTDS